MKLFSNLDEQYIYSGEEFETELLKSKGWNTEKGPANVFVVYSTVSVGTLKVNGIHIRIKANIQIDRQEDGSIKVFFSTKFRPEHYFLFILFAACCIIFPLNFKANAWAVIYPLVLWFPFHVFFQFIVRVQEEMLVNKIVQKLRLKALTE